VYLNCLISKHSCYTWVSLVPSVLCT